MMKQSVFTAMMLCILYTACTITEHDIVPATQESEAVISPVLVADDSINMDFIHTPMYSGIYGRIVHRGWTVLLDTGRTFTRQWIDSLDAGITLFKESHRLLPKRYEEVRSVTIIYFTKANAIPADVHSNKVQGGQYRNIVSFHIPLLSEKFLHEIGHVYNSRHVHLQAHRENLSRMYDKNKWIWETQAGEAHYASKNRAEYFAEMYRFYFTEPEYLKATDIDGYEMIANLEEWGA